MEKFCSRKAARFLRTGSFLFAHYVREKKRETFQEVMYFWNGFHILEGNTAVLQLLLKDIERTWQKHGSHGQSLSCKDLSVDRDDESLFYFLRALCLRALQSPFQAEESLLRVIAALVLFLPKSHSFREGDLRDHFYLIPNATFELSQVRISQGRLEEAEILLNKARSYKGYSMENKLHFRIHASMENLGARTPLP